MSVSTSPAIFESISSIDDLGSLLQSSGRQLRYLLYGRSEGARYTEFTIAKRSGGTRTIKAPKQDLKLIQRRLVDLLQDRIAFRQPVHGFVRKRSIASNAALHVQHRVVFNLDLQDFFPTINFGRVRGIFMADPCNASPSIATVLAQLCCHEGVLPQGAPTSPVLSNMICYKMDAQLQQLAKRNNCVYTRYADDLTFSKRSGALSQDIVSQGILHDAAVGRELREIVERNGFKIHPAKVHLYRNTCRQSVTGLVVNARVNVSRDFIRALRAIICDWRKNGLGAAEATHHGQFYRRSPDDGRRPTLHRIVQGRLSFLKMVRGADDKVRRNLQRQLVQVWPDYGRVMVKENRELDSRDLFISHAHEDKEDFVRPLVDALIREGVTVWYDEFEITIGDTLITRINEGLCSSRYGVVVLSPNFFAVKKTWPDHEVGALFAQQDVDKRPRVLPIWHEIDKAEVTAKSPILGGKMAWKSSDYSPAELASKFRDFLKTR